MPVTHPATLLFLMMLLGAHPENALFRTTESALLILNVELGTSDLADLLHRLGAPNAVYLAGADGEGGGSPTDPVIVRYDRVVCIDSCGSAAVTFTLRTTDYVAEEAFVEMLDERTGAARTIPWASIESYFGERYRLVRQPLDFDGGGLEGVPRSCSAPNGDLISFVFQQHGVQVFVDSAETPEAARSLRFSPNLILSQDPFPPCPPEMR